MKKSMSVLLSLVLSCGILAGCKNEPTKPNHRIWSAPNTVNIMRDLNLDLQEEKSEAKFLSETSSMLEMDGIKGDVESIQLMFTAAEDIKSFNFTIDDLTNEKNKKLSKSNFEILAERYIEVKAPTTGTGTANKFSGWYPDALVPLDRYKARKHDKVANGNHQGIWINATIPQDADSGIYEGTGKLTLDSHEYDVPIKITVYNVEMPAEIHSISAFDMWYQTIGKGESIGDDEEILDLYEKYYWFATDKRIGVQTIPGTPDNPSTYAKFIVPYAQNNKVSGYRLPFLHKSNVPNVLNGISVDGDHLKKLLTAMIDKNIDLRKADPNDKTDLFKKAYFYFNNLIDEPHGEMESRVRDCDLQVSKAKLALRDRLVGYPDLYESFKNLPHVVTASYNENYTGSDTVGGVQTWCPLISTFNDTLLSKMEERKNSSEYMNGEGFWWYNCIGPNNPYPTYHTDDNLISSRVMRWMQYDYKITGTLFWAMSYFVYYDGSNVVERDVWNDPLSFEGCNGDGQLLYPGSEYGVSGPISTLRLESIREGNEDFECLWLFEQAIDKLNADKGKAYNSNEILSKFYDTMYTGVITKNNASNFKKQRTSMLKLLELITNNQNQAITEIEKII